MNNIFAKRISYAFISFLVGSCFVLSSFSQAYAQYVLVEEDFESGNNPAGWDLVDLDGDGSKWNSGYFAEGAAKAKSGDYVMFSLSWNPSQEKAIQPDNWMVLPALHLRAQATLTYYVMTGDSEKGAEHYAIMASTTGKSTDDFTQILHQETMGQSTSSQLRSGTPSAWQKRTVTIPASVKYIAFRHYNCSGQFYLAIDDVKITSASAPAEAPATLSLLGKEYDTTVDNADLLGDGKVSYNAKTRTLTLKDAKLESENDVDGIAISRGSLVLRLEGYNEITLTSDESIGIRVGEQSKMVITGSGSLEITNFVKPAIGIEPKASLTVRNTSLTLSGGLGGIIGSYGNREETLVLDRATIYASGDLAGIASLHHFQMLQSQIANPSSAELKQGKLSADDIQSWGIFDGSKAATSVEIEAKEDLAQQHALTIKIEGNGTVATLGYTAEEMGKVSEGARIELMACPENPKEEILLSLTANGEDILSEMAFVVGDKDVEIVAKFGIPESIEDITSSRIRIYPNPARDRFVVEGGHPNDICRLINASGQIVDTFRMGPSGHAVLQTESFARGLYILQVGHKFHRVILE